DRLFLLREWPVATELRDGDADGGALSRNLDRQLWVQGRTQDLPHALDVLRPPAEVEVGMAPVLLDVDVRLERRRPVECRGEDDPAGRALLLGLCHLEAWGDL